MNHKVRPEDEPSAAMSSAGSWAAVRRRCGYGLATVRRRCGNNLVFTLITQVKLYRFSKPPFCNAILAFARMLANFTIELGGT